MTQGEHLHPKIPCVSCGKAMPLLFYVACFSCTHPKAAGETPTAYRDRVQDLLRKLGLRLYPVEGELGLTLPLPNTVPAQPGDSVTTTATEDTREDGTPPDEEL